MAVYGEALAAVTASCNFGVVVVAIATAIAARGNIRVVGAVIAAAVVGGWLFAADVSIPFSRVGGTVLHTVVLSALVVGVFVARKRIWVAAALGGLAEFLSIAWWRPCVGSELASIINRGANIFGSTGIGMAIYMLGLLTPALVIAAVAHIIVESFRSRREPALVGGAGDA